MHLELVLKPADVNDDPEFALINAAMQKPDVATLTIRRLHKLDVYPSPELSIPPRSSPVTALELDQCGVPHKALSTILSWPERLQILEIASYPLGHGRYPPGTESFGISGVIEALSPQQLNLEELYYNAYFSIHGQNIHDTPVDFRRFTSLRKLALTIDFLFEARSVHEFLYAPYDEDEEWRPVPLEESLPSALEILVLDFAYSNSGFFLADHCGR